MSQPNPIQNARKRRAAAAANPSAARSTSIGGHISRKLQSTFGGIAATLVAGLLGGYLEVDREIVMTMIIAIAAKVGYHVNRQAGIDRLEAQAHDPRPLILGDPAPEFDHDDFELDLQEFPDHDDIPRAIPVPPSPGRAAHHSVIGLLALGLLLPCLASCSRIQEANTGPDGERIGAIFFAGQRRAIGVELPLGRHFAPGIALTGRILPAAPPLPDPTGLVLDEK